MGTESAPPLSHETNHAQHINCEGRTGRLCPLCPTPGPPGKHHLPLTTSLTRGNPLLVGSYKWDQPEVDSTAARQTPVGHVVGGTPRQQLGDTR